MKERLNQKGMTLIELLAAFTITTVIVLSVLGSIMSYRNRAQALSIKKEIINYNNAVVQAIQRDIYQYGLTSATIGNMHVTGTDRIKLVLGNGLIKDLVVVHAKKNYDGTISRAYISYSDSIKQADGSFINQEVKYFLPYYGDIFDKEGNFRHSAVRFGQATVNNIRITYNNSEQKTPAVIKLNIPVFYGEGLNQEIEIIVPVSYPMC